MTLSGEATSLEIRDARLEIERPVESANLTVDDPIQRPEGTPDVLIIVLDAARASNFGAYGYPRDTTPFIDRLAADALVFTRAFSECPTTSCSIPNLISGIPFLGTGTGRGKDRVLSDDVTTLAQYLSGAGYYTIGFSDNANNAIARNTHRGFDEFHEMWASESRRRRPERRDPHQLSRRAADAIRAVEPTRPVFAFLHYLPPHKPFAPTPDFDVFGDPDYDGPLKPGMFREVRRGRQSLTPPDLDEMVALYDGNLRMVDDAVEEIFEALRDEGRWDNAIVLITSDHGEAFFEHGVQGHTSTLYDEMVHIPFILKIPGDHGTSNVDTDQLVISLTWCPRFWAAWG